jgi:hypothetical protein
MFNRSGVSSRELREWDAAAVDRPIAKESEIPKLSGAAREPIAETALPDDPLESMAIVDLVQEGLGAVAAEAGKLGRLDTPISPRDVIRVLDTAIHYGAPAYNRGSIAGCAEIYLSTCKGVCNVLERTGIPSDVPWVSPFERFVSILKTIAAREPKIEPALANRLAWELRHVFDAFQAALGIQEVQDVMDQIHAAHLPIHRDVILIPLSVAIRHGNRVYEAKDWKGCAELHHYTARRVCQFLEGAGSKSSLRSDPHLFLFHQDLQDILKKHPEVDPANAEALSWDLYSTFEQILKAAT